LGAASCCIDNAAPQPSSALPARDRSASA